MTRYCHKLCNKYVTHRNECFSSLSCLQQTKETIFLSLLGYTREKKNKFGDIFIFTQDIPLESCSINDGKHAFFTSTGCIIVFFFFWGLSNDLDPFFNCASQTYAPLSKNNRQCCQNLCETHFFSDLKTAPISVFFKTPCSILSHELMSCQIAWFGI